MSNFKVLAMWKQHWLREKERKASLCFWDFFFVNFSKSVRVDWWLEDCT